MLQERGPEGLHYQLGPHAQGKLVIVSCGAAFDVAVDIRKGSPTCGQWTGVVLSAENKKMLWVPEGFAHGFLALEDNTHFHYKTTDSCQKTFERAIRWDDPDIAIEWPDIGTRIVSEKDSAASLLSDADLPSNFHEGSIELHGLKVIGDDRGSLIALEQGQNIPFGLRRAYYIFDTRTDVSRGFHVHRRLEQMAVCVSGKCRMVLDDGHSKESVWLDAPDKAVILRKMIWREMHDFSDDCLLVVFASEHYVESDYIRNYDVFIQEVNYAKA